MAKRGRAISVDRLLSELSSLDKQRVALQARIKNAVTSAVGAFSGGESPFPWSKKKRGRPAGSKNKAAAGGRKRRKMSAKARAAISAAQKARWAKQKAGKK